MEKFFRNMKLEDFHLIRTPKDLHFDVLFHATTLTLMRIKKDLTLILEDFLNKRCDYESFPIHAKKSLEKIFEIILQKETPEFTHYNKITILLNVSHACNLRCKYCYANFGTYNSPGLMDEETAIKTIDVLSKIRPISGITFFGGEPTLNLKTIERVCKHITNLFESGEIEEMPFLGMVTNGTCSSLEFLNLIKKYNIFVTISVDGPQSINDLLRVYPDGRGTYREIKNTFERIKETMGYTPDIEVTYTQLHKEKGWDLEKLISFLEKEFSFNFLRGVIADVALPEGHPLALKSPDSDSIFFERAIKIMDDLSDGKSVRGNLSFLEGLIPLITKKPYMYMCPIGVTTFAVSANGNVYPCQLFIGDDKFCLGNVHSQNFMGTKKYNRVINLIEKYVNKQNNPKCSKCWAKALCKSCPGSMYKKSGNFADIPLDGYCKYRKKMIETTLVEIAKIQAMPDRWIKFVRNLKDTIKKADRSERMVI